MFSVKMSRLILFMETQGQSDSIPFPQSLQNYSFPGILHYLQVEWRRFERDRNEWELERSELRVSIHNDRLEYNI
jgi:hypothetical protein